MGTLRVAFDQTDLKMSIPDEGLELLVGELDEQLAGRGRVWLGLRDDSGREGMLRIPTTANISVFFDGTTPESAAGLVLRVANDAAIAHEPDAP